MKQQTSHILVWSIKVELKTKRRCVANPRFEEVA